MRLGEPVRETNIEFGKNGSVTVATQDTQAFGSGMEAVDHFGDVAQRSLEAALVEPALRMLGAISGGVLIREGAGRIRRSPIRGALLIVSGISLGFEAVDCRGLKASNLNKANDASSTQIDVFEAHRKYIKGRNKERALKRAARRA